MDAVDIFLLCVVAWSVLIFLMVDIFVSPGKRHKGICFGGEIISASEEQNIVGDEIAENSGECTTEEQNIVGYETRESEEMTEEEEEEEEGEERGDNPGRVGRAELGFCGKGEGEFGDDDWEGIVRTELEKIFGRAMNFCNSNADQIVDVKMELYGLQQVALQGPCHEPQPMALNIPARSKCDRNAWQKVGDMSHEAAMEKYLQVLSKAASGWKGEDKVAAIQDAAADE